MATYWQIYMLMILNGLWRRLEDDFRTLIASGFEFPDVEFPLKSTPAVGDAGVSADERSRTDVNSEDSARPSPASGPTHPQTAKAAQSGSSPLVGDGAEVSAHVARSPSPTVADVSGLARLTNDRDPKGESLSPPSNEQSEQKIETCLKPTAPNAVCGPSLQISRLLASRYDRAKIYRIVWSMPGYRAGQILGIKDISHVCDRHHIPYPPKQYWQELAANKPVDPAPPLLPVQVAETGRIIEVQLESSPDAEASASGIQPALDNGLNSDSPNNQGVEAASSGPHGSFADGALDRPEECRPSDGLGGLPSGRDRSTDSILNAESDDQVKLGDCPTTRDEPNPDTTEPPLPRAAAAKSEQLTHSEPGLPTASKDPGMHLVLASLASRYDRDQIYEDVWSLPMRTLARQYKLSDVGLAKTCRKLHVPIPPAGYWNKVAAKKPVEPRPPLPPVKVVDRFPRRTGRQHSSDEINTLLQQIQGAVAAGKTLGVACRGAEIDLKTFLRWRKKRREQS